MTNKGVTQKRMDEEISLKGSIFSVPNNNHIFLKVMPRLTELSDERTDELFFFFQTYPGSWLLTFEHPPLAFTHPIPTLSRNARRQDPQASASAAAAAAAVAAVCSSWMERE